MGAEWKGGENRLLMNVYGGVEGASTFVLRGVAKTRRLLGSNAYLLKQGCVRDATVSGSDAMAHFGRVRTGGGGFDRYDSDMTSCMQHESWKAG